MSRIFKNKKELAESLLKGEKWKIVNATSDVYCFFDEDSTMNETKSPFRFGTEEKSFELDGLWECANGIDKWEQIL